MHDNVKIFGPSFSEQLPEIIHHIAPDTSLYSPLIQEKLINSKVREARAFEFLDAVYYIAKVDGERLDLPASEGKKQIYMYDKDLLAEPDCWQILDYVESRKPSVIYFVYPIRCHTLKQFLTLRGKYKKISRRNSIILDYFVPLQDIGRYFGTYKLKLLSEITKTSNISFYLGKNYQGKEYCPEVYLNLLYHGFTMAFSYYTRNIPIRCRIFKTDEYSLNPYQVIYSALEFWINSDQDSFTIRQILSKRGLDQYTETFLSQNDKFLKFFDYTKKDLTEIQGVWRV